MRSVIFIGSKSIVVYVSNKIWEKRLKLSPGSKKQYLKVSKNDFLSGNIKVFKLNVLVEVIVVEFWVSGYGVCFSLWTIPYY